MKQLSIPQLCKAHGITRVDSDNLTNYFLRSKNNRDVVVMWYDRHTRDWVVYLVDEQGNQIGDGERQYTFDGVLSAARGMLNNPNAWLYEKRYDKIENLTPAQHHLKMQFIAYDVVRELKISGKFIDARVVGKQVYLECQRHGLKVSHAECLTDVRARI